MNDFYEIIIIGLIPTLSMIITSLLVICNENVIVNKFIESAFQSFSCGLILAATSIELFPLLNDHNNLSLFFQFVAILFGFMLGLSLIYGITWLINSMEDTDKIEFDINSKQNSTKIEKVYNSISSDDGDSSVISKDDDFEWEDYPVVHSLDALSSPEYKNKLLVKLNEANDSINQLDQRITDLYTSSLSNYQSKLIDYEDVTETIDKLSHLLEYQLDTSKRLIEGFSYDTNNSNLRELWLNKLNKEYVLKAMILLKKKSSTIIEIANENHFDIPKIHSIHKCIQDMHSIMTKLHSKVDNVTIKWNKTNRMKSAPIPLIGSTIPLGLVIPVCIDGLVDGFLIGLTFSISHRIGYIIAIADALEMGFLGIAVSIRIRKCTGSSIFLRYLSLIVPPITMLGSSLLGMLFGNLTKVYPFLYLTFISFGIIALISLAINELYWESRSSIDGIDSWWNATVLFFGIYIIIVISKLEP